MDKQDVVIVVPIYKRLDYFEHISMIQMFKVLRAYSICFVAPQSLDINTVGIPSDEMTYYVEKFEDRYFYSRTSYSEMCLTIDFYDRFKSYKYMLIHQTDAFVFSDILMDFVQMNYDYIGAPLYSSPYWEDFHVGNGGLSLRKIGKSIEILSEREKILAYSNMEDDMIWAEDLFWGYCGSSGEVDFRVPAEEIAGKFALENDSCNLYRYISKNGLPFGIHMWWQLDYPFWKPYIEEYGYLLPDPQYVNHSSSYQYYFLTSIEKKINGWLRGDVPIRCKDFTQKENGFNILDNNEFAVWGKGRFGTLVIGTLLHLGKHIRLVIDNKALEGECFLGIPVEKPQKELLLNNSTIIIAVYDADTKIIKQIEKICGKDYSDMKIFKLPDLIYEVSELFEDDDLYSRHSI